MKKIIAVICACVLMSVAFSGCSMIGTKITASDGQEYTFYYSEGASEGSYPVNGIDICTAALEELETLNQQENLPEPCGELKKQKDAALYGIDLLNSVYQSWNEDYIVGVCKNKNAGAWVVHGMLKSSTSTAEGVGVAIIEISTGRTVAVFFDSSENWIVSSADTDSQNSELS